MLSLEDVIFDADGLGAPAMPDGQAPGRCPLPNLRRTGIAQPMQGGVMVGALTLTADPADRL